MRDKHLRFWGPAEIQQFAAAAAEHLGIDLGAYVCALVEKTDEATWRPLAAGTSGAAPA